MGLPSIEFGPLFYTQVIVGLTPTNPTLACHVFFRALGLLWCGHLTVTQEKQVGSNPIGPAIFINLEKVYKFYKWKEWKMIILISWFVKIN